MGEAEKELEQLQDALAAADDELKDTKALLDAAYEECTKLRVALSGISHNAREALR